MFYSVDCFLAPFLVSYSVMFLILKKSNLFFLLLFVLLVLYIRTQCQTHCHKVFALHLKSFIVIFWASRSVSHFEWNCIWCWAKLSLLCFTFPHPVFVAMFVEKNCSFHREQSCWISNSLIFKKYRLPSITVYEALNNSFLIITPAGKSHP